MKKIQIYVLLGFIVLFIGALTFSQIRSRLVRETRQFEYNLAREQDSLFAAIYAKWSVTDQFFALGVKPYYQKYSLSCEIASLKMALDYKGVTVSEDVLIQDLPFATYGPVSYDVYTGRTIWGDPNKGFVGIINGKMPITGYGVYEKPILGLALKYRDAYILASSSVSALTHEIYNGNPVVVWGSVTKGKDISWHDPEGKRIMAVEGEHARVAVGFRGPVDAPTDILIIDPVYGKIQMPIDDFIRDWALLGNKAVIIR